MASVKYMKSAHIGTILIHNSVYSLVLFFARIGIDPLRYLNLVLSVCMVMQVEYNY